MAAGDTFRAAASDQLEIWAERTGCEIVVAEEDKTKASSGRQLGYINEIPLFFFLDFSMLQKFKSHGASTNI